MSDKDETSQGKVEEASAKPESPGGASSKVEPETEATESQPTREEIDAFRAFAQRCKEQNVDPEHLLPEFTRTRQALKQAESENQRWTEWFNQNRAAAATQEDPVAKAEKEWAEARQSFDPEAEMRALRNLRKADADVIRREAAQQAQQALELREGLTKAKEWGESDPLKLAEVYKSLTAEDLAIIDAHRAGRLEDKVLARRKERERRAKEAGGLPSLAGDAGGGRRVPGSLGVEDEGPIEVPAAIYYAFPESVAKKKWPNAKIVAS